MDSKDMLDCIPARKGDVSVKERVTKASHDLSVLFDQVDEDEWYELIGQFIATRYQLRRVV